MSKSISDTLKEMYADKIKAESKDDLRSLLEGSYVEDDDEELDEEEDSDEKDKELDEEDDDDEELDEEDEEDDDIEESYEDSDLYQDAEGKHAKVNDPVGSNSSKNKKSVDQKGNKDKKGVPSLGGDQSKEMKEQLRKLFAGKKLDEKFVNKAITIFQAEVSRRVAEIKESLENTYAKALSENIESLEEHYEEKLNGYFNVVINEWADDNRIALETGIRNEIAENLISGLRNVLVENYIDIPDEKVDLLAELDESIETLENKLTAEMAKNLDLHAELNEAKRHAILLEASRNLTETQLEKFEKMISDIDFISEKQFRNKISIIKENYFKDTPKEKSLQENMRYSNVSKSNDEEIDGIMGVYAKTLDRFNGKRG